MKKKMMMVGQKSLAQQALAADNALEAERKNLSAFPEHKPKPTLPSVYPIQEDIDCPWAAAALNDTNRNPVGKCIRV